MMEDACKTGTQLTSKLHGISDRKCILVLGMHRSGTSAVTRVINLLGVDLASELMPALPANPRGYWESRELMSLHDKLLECGSSRWDDWRPFIIPSESIECQERIMSHLVQWLGEEFESSQMFTVKDPRICRFVSFWLQALKESGTQPLVVIPIRHPFAVAESLFKRENISFTKGCLLWLRHVLDAESSTRLIPRAWVDYDNLLNDWMLEVAQISTQLGIQWPKLPQDVTKEVSEFLSLDLRHHTSSPQELEIRSDVLDWVRRVYQAIVSLISGGDTETYHQELDQVRVEFDNVCLAFDDLIRVEREDSAQQTLASLTVVNRKEFDERLTHCEILMGDHSRKISEASDYLSAIASSLKENFTGLNLRLDATDAGIDGIVSQISKHSEQSRKIEKEIANYQGKIDDLADTIYAQGEMIARLGEDVTRMSQRSLEQERSRAEQSTLLKNDMNAIVSGIADIKFIFSETKAQVDQIQDELERIHSRSFGQRSQRQLHKLNNITKPAKRALRLSQHMAVGLVTLRWRQLSRHDIRLPFYRKQLISKGLFNPEWYLNQNPDVAEVGMDPLDHWLRYGVKEGRDPSPEFDTDWYLEQYPHVARSGQNPLVHYLRRGLASGINSKSEPVDLFTDKELCKEELTQLVDCFQDCTSDVDEVLPELSSFEPLITVVVPNFNHAPFLRQRLDSIYNQTYRNFRVILLDDCSTDGSREILDEYQARYPSITTCHYNQTNSGGVFHQWLKAIDLASESPLIWIAESDDYCDHDFLQKLVPYFRDEAVMLAYSRVQFVNEDGTPNSFRFSDHLSPHIDPSKWLSDYVEAGHREVNSGLAVKNTIPNVSGVIFRPPLPNSSLFEDKSWLNMKVCGDWVLYLNLLAGGRVAYCSRTTNYFRFHSSNSSGKTHKDESYYQEHARVNQEVARLFKISNETLDLAREVTRDYYLSMKCGDVDSFERIFDSDKIMEAKAQRKPTIMISIFSFITGGGEIIPIRLANELKRSGYPVVVHCFNYQEDEPGVRSMLRQDIPVVRANTSEQILMMLEDISPDIINTHHQTIQHTILELMQEYPDLFESCMHIVTMHGMFEGLPEKYLDMQLSTYLDHIDGWIYTADKNLKPFEDRGLLEYGSFTKVPNGTDTPTIRSISRDDLGIEPNAFVLCEASRAIPEKGWHEAIESVMMARKISSRPIHLVLLGTGPVYEELSQQLLPPYIHLLGFTADVCSYYAMSDIAILPSTFPGESFPFTLVEAIMVGKPVIASDIGEIRAMITADSGGLAGAVIPIIDGKIPVEQMTESIVNFADNYENYEQARQFSCTLSKRYDVRKIAEQYLAKFTSTTKRSNGKQKFPPLLVQMEELRDMNLFDQEFYRQQYPDIAELPDPLEHYMVYGYREQRMPNDWFDFQYIRQSCYEIDQKGLNPLWYFGSYLKQTQTIKTHSDMHHWGYCPVCEQRRLFLAHFDTNDSFNNLRCIGCNGAPRDRAVAFLLDQYLPGWRKTARVHESSPCTPCLKIIAGEYSASQYYPEETLGTIVNGFQNENIEKLTFKDNTFDVVAALEVIEHVFNPSDMVREMVRCTRPGGIAVFTTVPGNLPVSRPRARVNSISGEIEHFFPPVYHGNPIGDGALLTWDFGIDFDNNIREWSDGAELIHWCRADEDLGIIEGGVPHIYLIKKPVV